MGRPNRADQGGLLYHALNRANGRLPFCTSDGDFLSLETVLAQALRHVPGMRLLAYCLMPNHWHLLLWPRADGEMSNFMHWLTLTHTRRWHAFHASLGAGHLYQGRYKSFPVQEDEHSLAVARYVECNAVRSGLVRRAEAWRWGSLWRRENEGPATAPALAEGPLPLPSVAAWSRQVNTAPPDAELEALRRSVRRGQPYGADAWVRRTAAQLDLESTLRPRGRPRKEARGA